MTKDPKVFVHYYDDKEKLIGTVICLKWQKIRLDAIAGATYMRCLVKETE